MLGEALGGGLFLTRQAGGTGGQFTQLSKIAEGEAEKKWHR